VDVGGAVARAVGTHHQRRSRQPPRRGPAWFRTPVGTPSTDRRTKFSATLEATAVVEEEPVDAVAATTRTRRPASVEESGGGGGVTGW